MAARQKLHTQAMSHSHSKVINLLKQYQIGYEPRKSQIISPEEISTFLNTAPDDPYT